MGNQHPADQEIHEHACNVAAHQSWADFKRKETDDHKTDWILCSNPNVELIEKAVLLSVEGKLGKKSETNRRLQKFTTIKSARFFIMGWKAVVLPSPETI